MSNNMQRLGTVLHNRMNTTAGASIPTTVELGTINANMSLSTDSLQSPIPKGDYMVDIRLCSNTYNTSSKAEPPEGGIYSGGDHSHRLPSVFRALQPGDRVLVVWCGHEPIVTAILVSS